MSYKTELEAATSKIEAVARWIAKLAKEKAVAASDARDALRLLDEAIDRIEKGRRAARRLENKQQ